MAPVAEIQNLNVYPKSLRMTHGQDSEREWYEWKRGHRKVAIQRRTKTPKTSWAVYFINGDEIGLVWKDETRLQAVGAENQEGLQSCLTALAQLGFKVVMTSTVRVG